MTRTTIAEPKLQHLMLAHDLTPEADLALQRAAQLMRVQSSRLSVVHVCESAEVSQSEASIRQELQARLQHYGVAQADIQLRSGGRLEVLSQLVRGLEPDLLLLGAHHAHSRCGFSGTTLEQLLPELEVAVLLVVGRADQAYQRALAAVDFSSCARRALCCLWPLLAEGSQLHALNILEGTQLARPEPDELAWQQRLLEETIEEMQQQLPPRAIHLQGQVVYGERYQCLAQYLQHLRPQVVALGVHSERGVLSQALVGGMVQWLLSQPPCDVLLAPNASLQPVD